MLIELAAKVLKDRLKSGYILICSGGSHAAGGGVDCAWDVMIRAVVDNVSFPRAFRAGHGM
jgi:hypothetical protein